MIESGAMLRSRVALLTSLLLVGLAAAPLGCGGAETYDSGVICLDDAAVDGFTKDDVLSVQIVFDDCISACAEDVEASCEIVVAGSTLRVEGQASWRHGGLGCAAVCNVLEATCVASGLEPGMYTIVSGAEILKVDLGEPLVGEDPSCPGPQE